MDFSIRRSLMPWKRILASIFLHRSDLVHQVIFCFENIAKDKYSMEEMMIDGFNVDHSLIVGRD
jgi:hypothetical protein